MPRLARRTLALALAAALAFGFAALRHACAAHLDPAPFHNTAVSGDCVQVASDAKRLHDSGAPNCGGGGGSTTIVAPQGRLTLQSGAPVMTADQVGVSTIYYDPFAGNSAPCYTGSADALDTITANQMSLALEASGTGAENSGDVFDIWWWHNAGMPVLCAATNGAGGGWSSDTGGSTTARGTGYSQLDKTSRPYVSNKNALTNCYNGSTNYGSIAANKATYLGTFYTSAAGQTTWKCNPAAAIGGGNGQLFLWNRYMRVPVACMSQDSTSYWSYSAATYRAADASNSNRISWVDGDAASPIVAAYQDAFSPSATTYIAIAIDATTPSRGEATAGSLSTVTARIVSAPLLGLNYAQALEYGTCTFYGGGTMGLFLEISM